MSPAPPAGFWRRYAAYSLDVALLLALVLPPLWLATGVRRELLAQAHAALQAAVDQAAYRAVEQGIDLAGLGPMLAADPPVQAALAAFAAALLACLLVAYAAVFLAGLAWFVGFEASPWRATPGKRAAGLQVARQDGGRAGPGRVLARFLAGIPSWFLLHVGHALAGVQRERRALHDLLAGTRVQQAPGAGAGMPRWARAWLWLQALALAALLAFVLGRLGWLVWEALSLDLA